jgi:hypothetical protein
MSMTEHPITPPLALIDQWWDEAKQNAKYDEPIGPLVATQAARWGADQELEACVNWLIENQNPRWAHVLRAARRPKAPSDKELALNALSLIMSQQKGMFDGKPFNTIRHALEALDD